MRTKQVVMIEIEKDSEWLCDWKDNIVIEELKEVRDMFVKDLNKEKPNVFSTDPVEDKKQIKKMVKAIDRLLDYYGAL